MNLRTLWIGVNYSNKRVLWTLVRVKGALNSQSCWSLSELNQSFPIRAAIWATNLLWLQQDLFKVIPYDYSDFISVTELKGLCYWVIVNVLECSLLYWSRWCCCVIFLTDNYFRSLYRYDPHANGESCYVVVAFYDYDGKYVALRYSDLDR